MELSSLVNGDEKILESPEVFDPKNMRHHYEWCRERVANIRRIMYFHVQPPEYITKNEVQLTPGEAIASQFNEDRL
jgi:hypothetical protein